MPLYERKPSPPVEADQWFEGKHVKGVHGEVGATSAAGEIWPAYAKVTTIQGEDVTIHAGEWVIMESDGVHAYPCSDEEFRKRYKPKAEDPPRISEVLIAIGAQGRGVVLGYRGQDVPAAFLAYDGEIGDPADIFCDEGYPKETGLYFWVGTITVEHRPCHEYDDPEPVITTKGTFTPATKAMAMILMGVFDPPWTEFT